jgi:SAM-dependent methyltransferase
MHESVMAWVGEMVAQLDLSKLSTLEVGSYNVNGSVRELFGGPYLGIDRAEGPGVDWVWDIEKGPFRNDIYDVVVSTEMLEHCVRPHLALKHMQRSLMQGGYLILTARGYGFPYHNPPDYLRYHPEAIRILMEDAGFEIVELCEDPQAPGVFAVGKKR